MISHYLNWWRQYHYSFNSLVESFFQLSSRIILTLKKILTYPHSSFLWCKKITHKEFPLTLIYIASMTRWLKSKAPHLILSWARGAFKVNLWCQINVPPHLAYPFLENFDVKSVIDNEVMILYLDSVLRVTSHV